MARRTREEIRAYLFPRNDYAIAAKIADLDDIPYTPTENLPTGSIVVLANRVLVANRDLVVGYEGSLTATGVFWFPKLTGAGTTIAHDTTLYWAAAAGTVTPDSNGGARPTVGVAVTGARDDDDRIRVILGG